MLHPVPTRAAAASEFPRPDHNHATQLRQGSLCALPHRQRLAQPSPTRNPLDCAAGSFCPSASPHLAVSALPAVLFRPSTAVHRESLLMSRAPLRPSLRSLRSVGHMSKRARPVASLSRCTCREPLSLPTPRQFARSLLTSIGTTGQLTEEDPRRAVRRRHLHEPGRDDAGCLALGAMTRLPISGFLSPPPAADRRHSSPDEAPLSGSSRTERRLCGPYSSLLAGYLVGPSRACAAGNSRSSGSASPASPVHPRACGELVASGAGTPGQARFIPAPAGNSQPSSRYFITDTVHPRACGELAVGAGTLHPGPGSSPRLRGTRIKVVVCGLS